ncbi:hypothetical protein ACJX0J_030267 [Zea mays]
MFPFLKNILAGEEKDVILILGDEVIYFLNLMIYTRRVLLYLQHDMFSYKIIYFLKGLQKQIDGVCLLALETYRLLKGIIEDNETDSSDVEISPEDDPILLYFEEICAKEENDVIPTPTSVDGIKHEEVDALKMLLYDTMCVSWQIANVSQSPIAVMLLIIYGNFSFGIILFPIHEIYMFSYKF